MTLPSDADSRPAGSGREPELRRRSLRARAAADRRARLRAATPVAAAGLLAIAAVVLGLLAWRGTAAPVPRVSASGVAPAAIERVISSLEATGAQPTGVAVSGDRLYVADPRRQVVTVLTRQGSHVATIGVGTLRTPVYVAVGPVDGRVYVSDRGLNTVAIFSETGRRLGILTPQGIRRKAPAGGSGWRPLALAFAPDQTLYVADSAGDQRIDVFSPTGSRIGTIGTDVPVGRTGRRLAFPNGIAATDSQVIVADSNNGRLLVFDRAGAFLRAVPTDGLPRGLAVLGDGRIVVADAATALVTVYAPLGRQSVTLGGGAGAAGFTSPTGVAAGPDGHVYVSDAVTGLMTVVSTVVPATASGAGKAQSRTALLVGGALACGLLAFAIVVFISRAHARARELV